MGARREFLNADGTVRETKKTRHKAHKKRQKEIKAARKKSGKG